VTHACRGAERRSGDTTPTLSLFLSAHFSHPSTRWLYTLHGGTTATNTHTSVGLHAHLRMHIGDPSHIQATTRARLDLECRCLVRAPCLPLMMHAANRLDLDNILPNLALDAAHTYIKRH
jgi:hypothetical protein